MRSPALQWQNNGYAVRQASLAEPAAGNVGGGPGSAAPEVIPTPEAAGPDPTPGPTKMFAPQFADSSGDVFGPMPYHGHDGSCGQCHSCGVHDSCDYGGSPYGSCMDGCLGRLLHRMSFFAGIHGFKGPVDVGQNGNFGFHEGLNFGAPLGDPWGYGYQLGFQAVHSNFSGYQINAPDDTTMAGSQGRTQLFFTGGIFRRADEGLQCGVVFDYVHDTYYERTDLRQIRSETALVFGEGYHELGYWGAYGLNRERFQLGADTFVFLQPNDIFAGFYRRHFTGGGQGRLWAGGTGAGQGIIGGEATVPLGTSWALENNFAYVIPKTSAANGGQREETWSVTISLVWYPGRPARSVFCDPYQPLFGVGDNSALLMRR